MRKIIHVDMDAFFASVEQRDSKDLRGKPVVVGGHPHSRGVVAACSYEARPYGIRSGMASHRAAELCPSVVFLPCRHQVYAAISQQIMTVLRHYTELVEATSLDEAYLDVTGLTPPPPSATLIAQEVRTHIYRATGLTASAGVSYNKFLAKIASDIRKPNGLFVIPPQRGPSFIEALPIERFHGVGKKTAREMHQFGIFYGRDLKKQTLSSLTKHFGKSGSFYYHVARGIDQRAVVPFRERKSLGREETFPRDLAQRDDLLKPCHLLAHDVAHLMSHHRVVCSSVTIKIKYADFHQITRTTTLPDPVESEEDLARIATKLLEKTDPNSLPVRLLGIAVGTLTERATYESQRQLHFPFFS